MKQIIYFNTLEGKLFEGDTDLSLTIFDKVAEYLHFDHMQDVQTRETLYFMNRYMHFFDDNGEIVAKVFFRYEKLDNVVKCIEATFEVYENADWKADDVL